MSTLQVALINPEKKHCPTILLKYTGSISLRSCFLGEMLRDQNPFWTHRLFQLPGIPLAGWSCKSVLSVQTFRLRNPSLPVERGSKRFHTHQQFNDASEACLIPNLRRFLHLNYRLKLLFWNEFILLGIFGASISRFGILKKNISWWFMIQQPYGWNSKNREKHPKNGWWK